MAEAKKEVKAMDAKAMIAEHAKKGTKIKYNDRKRVEVVVDTDYMKKGDILTPHRIMADQMIKDGLVKDAPEKKK